MKRLIIISSMALMLFSVPFISPESNIASIEASMPARVVRTNKTCYCFAGGPHSKQVSIHFDKNGNPAYATMDGNCRVYQCSENAPDGRFYQYYFYSGNETWYFNL